jgi:hypothetical protein
VTVTYDHALRVAACGSTGAPSTAAAIDRVSETQGAMKNLARLHVMTYGTVDDLAALSSTVAPDELKEVLNHAPPGVFDPRSWAYWHLMCGLEPRPLPTRSFG